MRSATESKALRAEVRASARGRRSAGATGGAGRSGALHSKWRGNALAAAPEKSGAGPNVPGVTTAANISSPPTPTSSVPLSAGASGWMTQPLGASSDTASAKKEKIDAFLGLGLDLAERQSAQ